MIRGINHLTLSVCNVEASFSFYTQGLGFRPVAKWPFGAYLLAGDLWVALVYDEHRCAEKASAYTHVAFSVSAADVGEMSKRIMVSGAEIWQENHSEGASLYFTAPHGHQLEHHASELATRLPSAKVEPWEGLEFFV